ncbi:dicarboxylate/amino acid:cation symporter [Dethiothermospora halolimnae]|uniref:dicarboxylate/amino acid:cation symporter n=1 Tax=Dethiothermospora halolimnae TaxID=3114390 RepID=UPI003CCBAC2D
MKKLGLTSKIFIGLISGAILGIILNNIGASYFKDTILVGGIFELMGQIFLRAIKMMVVPLVFVSIVNGAASISDIRKLGRVGSKTILFYILTTTIAISLAIGLGFLINPGVGLDMSQIDKIEPTIGESKPLVQVFYEMVPTNPIKSFTEGAMLQIIVFAMLVGVGLAYLGDKVKGLIGIFEQLNELVMKIVDFVMLIAPYGVFALIAKTFASLGFEAMGYLLKYMITVILALLIHGTLTYSGLLVVFTKLNPIRFIKKLMPAMGVAFSTASSSATIPVTLETIEKDIGASKSIASFTIPLGATINMDGTAIMQGVATVFISQIYGVDLSIQAILTVIMTATLASIGTAGVPGVGLIMLSMVLQAVNIPVEGIALIIGIDRILDMARTAINITGDSVCTTIVCKTEGEFDEEVFNS